MTCKSAASPLAVWLSKNGYCLGDEHHGVDGFFRALSDLNISEINATFGSPGRKPTPQQIRRKMAEWIIDQALLFQGKAEEGSVIQTLLCVGGDQEVFGWQGSEGSDLRLLKTQDAIAAKAFNDNPLKETPGRPKFPYPPQGAGPEYLQKFRQLDAYHKHHVAALLDYERFPPHATFLLAHQILVIMAGVSLQLLLEQGKNIYETTYGDHSKKAILALMRSGATHAVAREVCHLPGTMIEKSGRAIHLGKSVESLLGPNKRLGSTEPGGDDLFTVLALLPQFQEHLAEYRTDQSQSLTAQDIRRLLACRTIDYLTEFNQLSDSEQAERKKKDALLGPLNEWRGPSLNLSDLQYHGPLGLLASSPQKPSFLERYAALQPAQKNQVMNILQAGNRDPVTGSFSPALIAKLFGMRVHFMSEGPKIREGSTFEEVTEATFEFPPQQGKKAGCEVGFLWKEEEQRFQPILAQDLA